MFIVLSLVLSAFMQCWCKDIKKIAQFYFAERYKYIRFVVV